LRARTSGGEKEGGGDREKGMIFRKEGGNQRDLSEIIRKESMIETGSNREKSTNKRKLENPKKRWTDQKKQRPKQGNNTSREGATNR
jgi:hypothetical protein